MVDTRLVGGNVKIQHKINRLSVFVDAFAAYRDIMIGTERFKIYHGFRTDDGLDGMVQKAGVRRKEFGYQPVRARKCAIIAVIHPMQADFIRFGKPVQKIRHIAALHRYQKLVQINKSQPLCFPAVPGNDFFVTFGLFVNAGKRDICYHAFGDIRLKVSVRTVGAAVVAEIKMFHALKQVIFQPFFQIRLFIFHNRRHAKKILFGQ